MEAAEAEFAEFRESWEALYPAVVKLWQASWETFTPSLALPAEMRRLGRPTTAWTGRCCRVGNAACAAGTGPQGRHWPVRRPRGSSRGRGRQRPSTYPQTFPANFTSGVTDQSGSDSHCQERFLVIAGSTGRHDQPHA